MSEGMERVTLERLLSLFREQAEWRVLECAQSGGIDALPVLYAHRLGRSPDCPRILVSAGIHGDEPAGTLALMEFLQKGCFSDAFEWIVFPALNPYGLLAGTRENTEGRDLNRDFKRCRCVETCFYVEQVSAFDRIDLHLCLHEDWEYDQAYLYELNSGQRPSIAAELLEVTDRCIGLVDAPLIDGHLPTARGFIHHAIVPDEPEGWPEAIFLTHRYALLSYTLETPSSALLSARVDCMLSFLEAALQAFEK